MIAVGRVVRTLGHLAVAALPGARVGDGVRIHRASGDAVGGRVAALERTGAVIMPFGSLAGVAVGDRVVTDVDAQACVLGYGALGRSMAAGGEPLDGKPPLAGAKSRGAPTARLEERRATSTPFWTGVRVVDGLLTIGAGARIGLFGAPGAGKTTLLDMISRGARADAVVVGLVGERGREAARWLSPVGARTTVVCATADRSPAERVRAAEVAMAQSVTLRDRGLNVLLILDSLARYASALREIRCGAGEPVGRGGYPPSVFAELAAYVETAGNTARGTLTMIATVLSDGGDEREPLSDAARASLDGHFVLSTEAARAGRFPAIDPLASVSRTMADVVTVAHARAAATVRAALARLADTRDLRSLGIADAADPLLSVAVAAEPEIRRFLEQRDLTAPAETMERLASLAANLAAGDD